MFESSFDKQCVFQMLSQLEMWSMWPFHIIISLHVTIFPKQQLNQSELSILETPHWAYSGLHGPTQPSVLKEITLLPWFPSFLFCLFPHSFVLLFLLFSLLTSLVFLPLTPSPASCTARLYFFKFKFHSFFLNDENWCSCSQSRYIFSNLFPKNKNVLFQHETRHRLQI